MVTRAEFVRHSPVRRGRKNPSRVKNAAWEWMLRENHNAYMGREHFAAHDDVETPTWTFERFGCSCTALPDGRRVCIAGEHEDHYDPDFFIYNDVTVLTPRPGEPHVDARTCGIEMFGYSESAFAPTDFHTATLVGEKIWVIGNVGYPEDRRDGVTPVFRLDTATFAFEKVHTSGDGPGWLSRHAASYDAEAHAIDVGSGRIARGAKYGRNEKAFRLHLEDGRWERLGRTTMRRRYEILDPPTLGEIPEVPAMLTARGFDARQLFTRRKNTHDTYQAEIGRALVTYEDWGTLIVDGRLTDDEAEALLDGMMADLGARTGCEWGYRNLPEHERD